MCTYTYIYIYIFTKSPNLIFKCLSKNLTGNFCTSFYNVKDQIHVN